MVNILIGCIFLFAGIDIFLNPVYQSHKCGGCEIDLRPYHYFIGPLLVGVGSYFLYSFNNKKAQK